MTSKWQHLVESPAWMFTKALSHRQKVMRLYKKAIKHCDEWYGGPKAAHWLEARYQKVIMRARFDVYKDEKDPRKASLLLAEGCRQLWEKSHHVHIGYPDEHAGSQSERNLDIRISDQLYDTYTWVEREQFPYYFARREQRKKELLDEWGKIEKAWDDQIAAIQTEVPKEDGAEGESKDGEQQQQK